MTNLISERDYARIWQRHVNDSLQLYALAPDKLRWVDFGSGAGFPGIVLGIVLAETHNAEIHCIESDARKCVFLRHVVSRLELPVKIHNTYADKEAINYTGQADVVTARAFSSVNNILGLSERYIAAGAALILPRGEASRHELEEVDSSLYKATIRTCPTPSGGFFLEIRTRGVARNEAERIS